MTHRMTPRRWRDLICGEAGATAVEYALMVSLIALMIFGGAWLVGPNLRALFDEVANSL